MRSVIDDKDYHCHERAIYRHDEQRENQIYIIIFLNTLYHYDFECIKVDVRLRKK